MVVVVVRYKTTATARWALLFIVRAFFNDTITVAVWTGFHVRRMGCYPSPAIISAGASLIRLFRHVRMMAALSRIKTPASSAGVSGISNAEGTTV